MKHEFLESDLGDSSWLDEPASRPYGVEGMLAEADMAARVDEREAAGRIGLPEANTETVSPDENPTESRTREMRQLRNYQERARAQIPGILRGIVESEFQTRRKSGYRIGGELGRKGKRGL